MKLGAVVLFLLAQCGYPHHRRRFYFSALNETQVAGLHGVILVHGECSCKFQSVQIYRSRPRLA